MKGDRDVCIKAGMDDYIAKPIQPDELLRVLERYISRQPCNVSRQTTRIILKEDTQ